MKKVWILEKFESNEMMVKLSVSWNRCSRKTKVTLMKKVLSQ